MLHRFLACVLCIVVLTACGGGSSTDSNIVTQVNTAGTGTTLQVKLVDAAGVIVKPSTIDINGTGAFVQATVRDSAGAPIASQAVTFSASPLYGTFVNGSTVVTGSTVTGTYTVAQIKGISDTAGVVKVLLKGRAVGTDTVTVETKVGVTAVTTNLAYQIASSTGSSSTSPSNGRIKQGSMSISSSVPYIEGFDVDGAATELTVRATDRLGNPVAPGTVVQFATSHGLIGSFASVGGSAGVSESKGSCVIDAQSLCKVKLISSGPRPANGKVTILAYADGEESFVKLSTADIANINKWVAGDTFNDMGQVYLDRNGNGVYDIGIDDPIGMRPGTAPCIGTTLSIADTCDGTWSPLILARHRFEVIWSTSGAKITQAGNRTLTSLAFTVLDLNGNPMSTGNTVVPDILSSKNCSVIATELVDVPTGLWNLTLNGNADCATSKIQVTVTSPTVVAPATTGTKTSKIFN